MPRLAKLGPPFAEHLPKCGKLGDKNQKRVNTKNKYVKRCDKPWIWAKIGPAGMAC